jgi:hypothetical protein
MIVPTGIEPSEKINESDENSLSTLDAHETDERCNLFEQEKESLRCGVFTFSQKCSAFEFFHYDIYGLLQFETENLPDTFVSFNCDERHSDAESETLNLGIGLTVKVDSCTFPQFAEHLFVVFGFVPDKKRPDRSKAILYCEILKKFHCVYICNLRVHPNAADAPALVKELFDDYHKWLQEGADNKTRLELCLLPAKQPPKQQQRRTRSPGCSRVVPSRESKSNANKRILDMSPPQKDKKKTIMKDETKMGFPCSCSNDVKLLKKKNELLSSSLTSVKKDFVALSRRVAILEEEKDGPTMTLENTRRTKQNKHTSNTVTKDSASMIDTLKQFVKEELLPLKEQQSQYGHGPSVSLHQAPIRQFSNFPFMFNPAQTMQPTMATVQPTMATVQPMFAQSPFFLPFHA